MLAYIDCFWILAVLFASLIPFVFPMRKAEPGKTPARVH
jgi:hypothetical protein